MTDTQRPQVFISWSGEASRQIASALTTFLERVIQTAKPFFSDRDIDGGSHWAVVLSNQLQSCDLGVICLTKDNLEKHWLLFEAGALSKSFEKARVIPYFVGVTIDEIPEPFRQFQGMRATQEETLKLVRSINGAVAEKCGESWRQEDHILRDTVARHWDVFEASLDEACKNILPTAQLEQIPSVSVRTERLIHDLEEFKETHERGTKKPTLRYSGFLSPFAIHPDMVGPLYVADGERGTVRKQLAMERISTIALAKNKHHVKCMISPPCLSDNAPFLDLTTAPNALQRLKNLRDFLNTPEYKEIDQYVSWVVSPLALNNMYILGDEVCFEGLRKQRGSGYDLTLRYSDPGAVKTQKTAYEALWNHLAPQSDKNKLAGLKNADGLRAVLDFCIKGVEKEIKKTPIKKTPSKKTPSKKTPSKKTPSKKTPSKKTPSKKTPKKKNT